MITIANRLSRKESTTGLDVWYKTEVDGIHKTSKVENIIGQDVSMAETHIVLIPFSDQYRHFKDWDDKDNTYTLRVGDIIFFDTFDDAITPNNIGELKSQHEHCEVRSIEEAEKRYGATIQLKVSGV